MPRYFMHLLGPSEELLDMDGVLMPDEAVASAALRAARDCMAHDLRSGRIELKFRIEVHNGEGEVVHTLAFADAVEIVPA